MVLFLSSHSSLVRGQELYPFSEPASNMPARSIAMRLTNEGALDPSTIRTIPEIMIGYNKNLMTHTQVFLSDMDGTFRFEGLSLYAKYRFLSIDDLQKHFRMAAFGRVSFSKRDPATPDVNLEGDNSGWQTGIIATQLIHKLALSATAGYSNLFEKTINGGPKQGNMLNYSFSSGYLLLPKVYTDYKQPNFNLYAELLGGYNLNGAGSYLDLAPAIQLIINSKTRVDLGYRFALYGGLPDRFNNGMYLARVEFNFFNALN
ncbi:MAG: hypothetical protein EOO89_09665 [Pedobacter sp.]|nr:MAG: hypothetical protein EOO89_09665 [Pedobacter sp.]